MSKKKKAKKAPKRARRIHPVIWAAIVGAIGGIIVAIINLVPAITKSSPPLIPTKPDVKKVEHDLRGVEISAPFDVLKFFTPSGYMGDGEKGERLQINDVFRGNPRPDDPDDMCYKISYQPGSLGWAGIYWQSPPNNWGNQPGRNIKGAQEITFWARGEKGGEIVEFKAGGIIASGGKYRDSFEISLGKVVLPNEWKKYGIDLSDQNLSNVIGAFAWVVSRSSNPEGLTFYLDNIRYE
jgi:hypothetical protein